MARLRLSSLRPRATLLASYHPYQAGGYQDYREFCLEQRPLLPAGLRNAERETLLGQVLNRCTTYLY